ncbi:S protein [Myotis lucifugus coronavirus]|nr:S protein [Myotis lucifugus coronavirus]
MKLLIVLFLLPLASGWKNCSNPVKNFTTFFSTFHIPPNSVVVVGGYLPSPTEPWDCNTTKGVIYNNVNAVFSRYVNSGQGFTITASQSVFNPAAYQLYFHKPTNGRPDAWAHLRVCKWDTNYTIGGTENDNTRGKQCLFNLRIPFYLPDNKNYIVGLSWSGETLKVYSPSGIRTFFIPNSDWSMAVVECYHSKSCGFQPVSEERYYTINVTADGQLSYSPCNNCLAYADNVFAVEDGGFIPESFSFSNWFLLTNSSTHIQGIYATRQPLRLACLWAIPVLQGTGSTIWFNSTDGANCNGHQSNFSFDALRFNVNESLNALGSTFATGVTLYTVVGSVTLRCANDSEPEYLDAYGVIPFGELAEPFYCWANITTATNSTLMFIGVLPNSIHEVVVTAYGAVYINGYRYFQTSHVNGVQFRFETDQVNGFWTVAYATDADVLVKLNGTNIERVLYCVDPLTRLKCQQLRFELDDGFYPLAPVDVVDKPFSFVTLPTFADHMYVQFNFSLEYADYNEDFDLLGFNLTINGQRSYCVHSRQFTTSGNVKTNTGHQFYFYTQRSASNGCPFNIDTINNYLTFGKICFSYGDAGAGCGIDVIVESPYRVIKVTTIFVSYTDGYIISGMPKPSEGVQDVSTVVLDVCCTYSIYGHTGDGVIRLTNDTYLGGLYYTSPGGALLGFKNVSTGEIYSVTPCSLTQQVAVVSDDIVGVVSSSAKLSDQFSFAYTTVTDQFYYMTDGNSTCAEPVLTYSSLGVCQDGALRIMQPRQDTTQPTPIVSGVISIATNFTLSVVTEYIQLANTPISVDCAMYVCNGNPRCNMLLSQYSSACQTIESALQLSAKLESIEVTNLLTVSEDNLQIANITTFNGGGYNFTNLMGSTYSTKSVIEDVLFDKVVTSGLGTVDADYKACSNGLSVADLVCAQYYQGVMVLPGVVDAEKLHMYSASLMGGMALGGITAAAALPFSYAVQARLNYVALQTDVLQRNQQMLAESFNNAIGNITNAFSSVNDAISQTADGLHTVAEALSKVQDVVNTQGMALNHLTLQLQHNFQAISSSIADIYRRLDQLTADAQVDRLINGRLAALNAFVSQTLTKYSQVQASRALAKQKINECVLSQSPRFGFCGDGGRHVFTVTQAAPQGLLFLHTVLRPTSSINVTAAAGICVDGSGYALSEPGLVLVYEQNQYVITPRVMFEPRQPQISDFVRIDGCDVEYFNVTSDLLPDIFPDFIDVNKTLEDILSQLQNNTGPKFDIDIFNATYLNLSSEIADLELRSESLHNTTEELKRLIDNINSTLVDLEWLNRVETYIKWPWWVWLLIAIALIFTVSLLLFCCIATGCCGCCGCCASCLTGCCKGPRLQPYEAIEKVHVQ